jgi:hypothetical protein
VSQGDARIRRRIAAVVDEQRSALKRLEELLATPDAQPAAIAETQQALNRLTAEHTRLLTEWRLATAQVREDQPAYSRAGGRPLRERVLDVLDEIGVPAPPRVVSEVATLSYGMTLPASRLASLRRDEERAYRKDALSRPAWVVPALTVHSLTAIPRIIATSTWPLERRLIGARTLRANHLRTVISLLDALRRTGDRADERTIAHFESVLVSFAQSVSGALQAGARPEHERIRAAVEAELGHIEPLDVEERKVAAKRFEKLPETNQLWGQPALIHSRSAAKAR